MPIYVVGAKTASSFRAAAVDDGPASTDIDIRGQVSGSAADLARFVVQDVRGLAGATPRMLYLTGDKNRDVVMRVLAEGGVELETLRVYETRESPEFETRLSLVLEVAPKGASTSFSFSLLLLLFFWVLIVHSKDAMYWWIVYFAPSTAGFVTPILAKYFHLVGSGTTEGSENLIPARIAAIGPTTREFLLDQLRLCVDIMAQKPTPEGLVSALENHDEALLV